MSFYLIGIDEAGYGPQLGPLVVGSVVFELPERYLVEKGSFVRASCLWQILSRIISPDKLSSDKITVCDSKKLYQPCRGLMHLEKTALAFTSLIDPNYLGLKRHNMGLPVSSVKTDIGLLAESLKNELASNEIKFCEFKVKVVEPLEFNRGLVSYGNKADLLWAISSGLIKYFVDKYSGENIIFQAGKQGGRTYYQSFISKLFPDRIIKALKEIKNHSSYLVDSFKPSGKRININFIRDGDASEFVIALASIYAKYSRELGMLEFNRFFCSHIPGLKPTSGYYSDSRQFVRSIMPLLKKLNLDKDNFVRNK